MKTIFELRFSEYIDTDYFTDEVIFYERFGYDDLLEFLTIHNKHDLLSVKHLLKHAKDEFNEYLEDQYSWCYDEDECTFDEFKKEFIIDDDFDLELYDFMLCELNEKQIEAILNEIGIKFGTVGYSPWSYYIALDIVSSDFIDDLYNGYNIYDITQYDENGIELDSLCWVYAPNETDLINTIKDYFILDDKDDHIYLVENEASMYINHDKINKVETYYEKRFVI